MALCAVLAAWPPLASGSIGRWGEPMLGAPAVLALAVAVAFRLPSVVAGAIALLGGEYALYLTVEELPLDLRAPIVGAGLLVTAELAYWSLELRAAVTEEPGGHARRAAWIALLALAGLVVGAGLLALVDVAGREGLAVEIAGALAAAAAVASLLVGLRRSGAGRGGA